MSKSGGVYHSGNANNLMIINFSLAKIKAFTNIFLLGVNFFLSQPDFIKPGNNWHFQGEEATVVIELPALASITGFTLIHPTSRELPYGYFKSAPKFFEIYVSLLKVVKKPL